MSPHFRTIQRKYYSESSTDSLSDSDLGSLDINLVENFDVKSREEDHFQNRG